MLAFARFVILGFVLCTVVYVAAWFYLRSRRRGLLMQAWDQEDTGETLDDFLAKGHARYDRLRHRTLVALVYILPLVIVVTIIYRTNFEQ